MTIDPDTKTMVGSTKGKPDDWRKAAFVRDLAAKRAVPGMPDKEEERARDAVRHKHLSQSCLNELRKDRPASPPVPAAKRAEGRVRVRFYNNTPDDVDLYFMKQGFPKKMFDIQSGNKSGSFAMVGSKFHAESAAGKKYGPWVRASPPPATLIPSVPQDEI